MKKNWNVAKIFTLLITVLFLASTLFVGCKESEPEPTKYMVTYVTNPEGLQVENFPTPGEVEENTTIELPVLTLEGYTFDGWYDGDTKVESPYKVTKAVTLTAKFTENVAPSLPEDPTDPENPTNPDPSDPEDPTDPVDPVDPVVPEPVETFLVTYTVEGIDANLVTGLPETGSVNKDIVLTLSPLEAPAGYVFDGWFINDEGVEQHTVVADVTIVAKFSEKAVEYTIKNADSSWQNIVVHAWKDHGDKGFFSAVNDGGTVTFVANIPIEKCILILLKEDIEVSKVLEGSVSAWDNKKAQTLDLIIDGDNIATIPKFVEKVYLKPNLNWLQEGNGKTPRFAAVFISGEDWDNILWVNMIADNDMFVCDVPKGYDKVQFCRMNGNTEDNNWTNKYNNSNTLYIPFLGDYNILCTIPDEGWDNVSSWSTYTPE